jgi:signal transduction histidine kinase
MSVHPDGPSAIRLDGADQVDGSCPEYPVRAGGPRVPVEEGLTGRLRGAWTRLGEPSTLSLPVALLYLPVGAAGPLLLDRPRFGGSLETWIAITLATQGVLILALTTGGRLVHRGRSGSRPVATVIAICVSVMLRAMVLALLAGSLAVDNSGEYRYRVVGAIFVQAAFIIIIALVLNSWREHSALLDDLERQRQHLVDLDESMAARLEQIKSDLIEQIRVMILPRIKQIDDALDSISRGADIASSIATLSAVVEDGLRPLSYRLNAGTELELHLEPREPDRAGRRWTLPATMPVSSAFLPWLGGILISGSALTAAVRYLTPVQGLFFILSLSTAMIAGLLLARLLLARWVARLPVVALVTVPLPAGIAFTTVYVLADGHLLPVAGLQYSAGWVGAIIGAVSFAYEAVNLGRANTERELRETVERLAVSISALRQNCWVIQRRLGYVMHGSIQGALHAAAMRLADAKAPDPELIAAIRTDIDSAFERLDLDSTSAGSVQESLEDIASLWEGECDIRWHVTEEADAAISESRSLAECVAEIAREAVGNAIRHGRARAISLDVSVVDGLLVLRSSDDGASASPNGRPGLGSRMLEETCIRWTRVRIDGSTVLTTWLAIS